MGMDVYGLNPKRNTAKPEILIQYTNDEGFTEWDAVKADNKLDEYVEHCINDSNPNREKIQKDVVGLVSKIVISKQKTRRQCRKEYFAD